jgi:hypothetical protein
MIALVLAAAASVQGPSAAPPLLDAPIAMRARACGLWRADPVRRTAPAPKARRLIDLPRANLEIPVLRLGPDGCSKPVVVRYSVEGDGRFAGAGGGR